MKKTFTILSSILALLLIATVCPAQTGVWQELKPQNSPPARHSFGMAEIGEGKAIIFGGDNGHNVLDETWIYDINENTWTEIKCDKHPAARSDLMMSRITKNKVLLYGGWIDGSHYFSDTWIFDLETLTWTEFTFNTLPLISVEGRRNTGFAQLSDNKVILFGGETVGANYANDIWVFDLNDTSWSYVNTDINSRPIKCSNLLMAQIDTGKVLIYGGWHYDILDQTWLFDYNLKKWIRITPENSPPPNKSSSMAKIGKNQVVFWGGDPNGWGQYNELWLFDLKDSLWKKIETSIKPDGRRFHRIVNIKNNKILLFGGLNAHESIYHNDSWLLSFESNDIIDNLSKDTNIQNSFLIQNDKAHIHTNLIGFCNYKLYDIYGKVLKECSQAGAWEQERAGAWEQESSSFDIDATDLSNGVYFLVVQGRNKREVFRLMIAK
ncbi:MAG: kelch repeat-containing protein [Bacteroidota bacterium]